MSTNAYVFIAKENNLFDGIYIHFDGSLRSVGQILFKHYRNTEKIQELINLGALSSLDCECSPPPPYISTCSYNSNKEYVPGYTFASHRDRGEDLDIITNIPTEGLNQYTRTYVWKNNEWWYIENNIKDKLESRLKALEKEHNNYTYTIIPSKWEIILTDDEFRQTIRRGFMITNNKDFQLNDSIVFKADDPENMHKHYELLIKVRDLPQEEGLKEGYRLVILDNPPKDLAWYQSVPNSYS